MPSTNIEHKFFPETGKNYYKRQKEQKKNFHDEMKHYIEN
jgi:hypothetical protein